MMAKSLWFANALLPDGWAHSVTIRIEDGLIAAIVSGAAPDSSAEQHGIALPGLPNVHSHAFQRGMAGLAETRGPGTDSFWTWREAMYRFIDVMTPDDMQAIAEQAYVEMLEGGFTHVAEFHYLHHAQDGSAFADRGELSARIAAASETAGIGLTLLPVFYAHAGFGGLPPTHGQRRFINDLDGYSDIAARCAAVTQSLPGARTGIAPHSLRAATPDELQKLVTLAGDNPIHIHIAEQVKEVEDCVAWSGQRPVEWLLDHATVNARWCLIHATHMTDNETRRMAASGAVAGLCPITEANLGDGIFPVPLYRTHGGLIGIGSDSNVRISMPAELEILEYGQRLSLRGRNIFSQTPGESTGRALFDAALAGGAQACGQTKAGLQVGASADFITLKTNHPALAASYGDQILDGFIFARHDVIDGVWRNGIQQVAGGFHKNREATARRYDKVMKALIDAA